MQSLGNIMPELQERIKRIRSADRQAGSIESPEYKCRKCKDEGGFLIRDHEGVERWRFCECNIQRRTENLIAASQITPEFRKRSFQNFRTKGRPASVLEAYEAAKEYLQSFPKIRDKRQNSIALLGVPGSGKTHLLMAISNALLQDGVGVLYFPWVEGFNDLKADFDLLESKIHRLQTVPVLFIDDALKGRTTATDFQREQLFAIVNYRYLNNLPILLSSEWDFEQICDFDMGTGSRLYEMCRDYAVVIKGGLEMNYRLTGG